MHATAAQVRKWLSPPSWKDSMTWLSAADACAPTRTSPPSWLAQVGPAEGELVNRGPSTQGFLLEAGQAYRLRMRLRSEQVSRWRVHACCLPHIGPSKSCTCACFSAVITTMSLNC